MNAPAQIPETGEEAARRGFDILVVGVGGQGVLFISKVIAALGQRQGLDVKQSEVHGMAKRGGIVFSHVRAARQVWSPTIAKGQADAVIALEWAEALRWLDFLKPDTGVLIADTRRIVPPFACLSRKHGARMAYSRQTPADVVGKVARGYAADATGLAAGLGDARAANTVLLGMLSACLDYPVEDWRALVEMLAPKGTREVNLKAFDAGRAWVEAEDAGIAAPAPETRAEGHPALETELKVELTIEAAWCKGCDICVKLCPERCLALDPMTQVAVLARPEQCTGCRVCEWLCPDFAIAVRRTEIERPVVA